MNDATIMVQVAAKYAYESISSGKFPGGPPFFDAARKVQKERDTHTCKKRRYIKKEKKYREKKLILIP